MTSFIQQIIKPQPGVSFERLVDKSGGGVMFDVPNPESDIDPDSTAEDGRKAFVAYLEKLKTRKSGE